MLIQYGSWGKVFIKNTRGNDVSLIKKWGNSASVRIPSWIMESIGLNLDETVDIRAESGRIIIEPINLKEFELRQLLSDITPENLHAEVDSGTPVGRELL